MTITHHVAKKFTNKTSGTKMTWWKTSFNMPVPNIFDNNSTYTETEWMLNATGEATSFDLSGFDAWWEVVCASSVFTLYGPFAGGTVNIFQEWKDPSGTVLISNNTSVSFPALSAWYWSSYQLAMNIGIASWEISAAGTYSIAGYTSGAHTASQSQNIVFSNVPSVSTYTPGMMWVEWNNLCWSSANGHIHKRSGTDMGNPWATPGYIWIYGSYIYWIWSDGHKYVWPINFQQFSSIFYNGPSPWVVSWQTPWFMWADSNFWWEHIWYIAESGYKWIMPSGEDPYA